MLHPSYGWITLHGVNIPHFVDYLQVERHLGCFRFGTSIPLLLSTLLYGFSCEYTISVISGMCLLVAPGGRRASACLTLQETVTPFSIVAAPFLLFHQQCPVSPHPCWHLMSVYFMLTTLNDVKECLLVILICVYLMTNGVKHLFICLLAIGMPSWEKYLLIFTY